MSASLGEDCCAIKTDKITLYSSDPITACDDLVQLGSLVVDVCCNDVSACGGVPIAILLTLILPSTFSKEDVGVIMDSAQKRAEEIDMDIIGGHTEFSDAVIRPIACGTAIGVADKILTKKQLKVGDSLIVTKSLGMEGVSLLASKFDDCLTDDERSQIAKMKEQLNVLKESSLLAPMAFVGTMHDVTEGGVLGAVAEICEGAGLGAEVYEVKMPIEKVTDKVCGLAGVDVLRILSSGSLLVSTSDPTACIDLLQKNGVRATEIGCVTDGEINFIAKDGTRRKINILPDEMCRIGEKK